MESVAEFFGKKVLRDVDEETFLKAIPEVRKVTGDRAVVRAIHFYNDSRRAGEIYEAIKADDFDRFLQLIIEGGHSSFEFNQNAYSIKNPQEQGVPLALAISQKVLNGRGAWRLQGGGLPVPSRNLFRWHCWKPTTTPLTLCLARQLPCAERAQLRRCDGYAGYVKETPHNSRLAA